MPRKSSTDACQVISIIKESARLIRWEFIGIDKKSEAEVAEILQSSALFLSFTYQEGFSLPSAEAIACGCIVIGNHGQGGKEYFNRPYAYTVETGNIIAFVKEVEYIALDYEKNTQQYLEYAQEGSKKILELYSPENEKEDIINAWNNFQKGCENL
jgi:glycosyltransferase involved in cell wall biosynthesis